MELQKPDTLKGVRLFFCRSVILGRCTPGSCLNFLGSSLRFGHKFFLKSGHRGAHLLIQERPNLPAQFFRHAKISAGHAASDGAGGITIAAQGNGVPDCLLQTLSFKKSFESLGYGTLTGFIKLIGVPDGVQGKIPVVIIFFQILTDLMLVQARPG